MRKTRLLALAAALSAGVVLPASAQPAGQYDRGYDRPGYGPAPGSTPAPGYTSDRGWDRIGSVDFALRPEQETQYGNFGGRVERLSFVARNGTVRCNTITATFNNGRTRELYRGTLQRGRNVVVDMPGQSRMIRR